MKHLAQDSFEDDLSGDGDDLLDDVDKVFARLGELRPPIGFVNRMMQAISRLPLPQMFQPGADCLCDDDHDLIVHHEHKQPS